MLLFCGKCSKAIKKTWNLVFCFHHWFYLNFINTCKSPLLSPPVTDFRWNNTAPSRYIRQNRQFHFLDLTLPKNGFRFWNSENKYWNKNPHTRDTMCANFQAKWTNLTFWGQICPKIDFWFEIQKTNIEVKISILETPRVPIFRLWLFWPKFAQKGI